MSENTQSGKGLVVGVTVAFFILLGIAAAYAVTSQSKISQLQQQLEGAKSDLNSVQEEVKQAQQEMADAKQSELADIAAAIADVDSPALRFTLVKHYYDSIKTLLKPASKNQLDAVIVYIDKNPEVLIQPDLLPTQYSDMIASVKAELQSAKVKAIATVKQSAEESNTASASSIVGKTFTLTGLLSFMADDPVLGGSYFTLTATNYGEPYVLYFNPETSTMAKTDLVGNQVTVSVKVTSQGDGYVTYDVVSGPTKAE